MPIVKVRGATAVKKFKPERAAAGRQQRGAGARPLLPEFGSFLSVKAAFSPSDPRTRPGHCWQPCTIDKLQIPAGARNVRTWFDGGSGAQTATAHAAALEVLPSRGCLKFLRELGPDDLYIGRETSWHGKRLLSCSK